MIVIRTSSVPPQRWKNGGGLLRELLLRPGGADWQLRIAVAEIDADGPFSEFAGVTRHFTVIRGRGVELSVNAGGSTTTHRLRVGDPTLLFDGGAASACRLLDGSVSALNLMLRAGDGRVEPAIACSNWTPGAASCGFYAAVNGRCNGMALTAETLLWFDSAPAGLRFDVDAGQAPAGPPGWWLAANPPESRQ